MFLTIHCTVGAIAGKYANNILLAFLSGFILHFIFDAIPHGDEKLLDDHNHPRKKELILVASIAMLDGIVFLLTIGALWYFGKMPADWAVLSGVVGGAVPDLNSGFYLLTKSKIFKPLFDFHFKIHTLIKKIELTLIQGIIFQIAIEAAIIAGIFYLP